MLGEISQIKETNQIDDSVTQKTINDIINDSMPAVFAEFRDSIARQTAQDTKPISEEKGDILQSFLEHKATGFVPASDDYDPIITDEDKEKTHKIYEEFKALSDKYLDKDNKLNCLCFALGITDNGNGGKFKSKPNIGEFSGKCSVYELLDLLRREGSDDRLFELLEADCEAMGKGFKRVDENYIPKDGETLACLMYSTTHCDFHFARAGKSGGWFHKPGNFKPDMTDSSCRIITKPEESDWGMYDQFCGRFVTWDKK